MNRTLVLILPLVLASASVTAKLPPPSDEAKAKAAEAAAKTAHGNKVADYQLCKAMERVAATYRADAKKSGKEAPPAVETPPCSDPGVFAVAAASAPEAKRPIEAAGAHSPPKTATEPPSTTTPSAATSPKK